MTREQFLRAAIQAACASSAKSGLLAGVTVAQAALESAFGRSQLSSTAQNYFGIKARKGADFVAMRTREVVSGANVMITARFARFATMEECFAYRDSLILRLPCYAEARSNAADAERFAQA